MLIRELENISELTIVNSGNQDNAISSVYIGDLLSIVMGNAVEDELWLTVQTHTNVIAIASLKELSGIVFVEGQEAESDTIEKAKELGIPLFATKLSAFELTKKLISLGL